MTSSGDKDEAGKFVLEELNGQINATLAAIAKACL
jgi:hypothetical protein